MSHLLVDGRVRLQLALALLLTAAALAGCAGTSTTTTTMASTSSATSAPLPTDLKAPTLLPDVVVGSPGGGAEPNIAQAPDGTIYASSPLSIWKSTDHGKTWTACAAKNLEGGGDGDLAVDGNGTVYWLGLLGNSGRAVPFQRSTDGCAAFSPAVDVSDGSGQDREWIFATPDGRIYTTWRGASGLEFRMSPDGGATWGKKVTATPDANQGPITRDPASGRLYYANADFAQTTGTTPAQLRIAVSDDDGASWTQHGIATLARSSPVEHNGYVTDFAVTGVDGNGTVYVTWSMDMGVLPVTPPSVAGEYGIFVAHSTDGGATWSKPTLVSDATKYSRMPWLAAGAAGRLAVAWYEDVHGVPGEEVPDQWNVKLWESLTADQAEPKGQTVTLSATPNHVGALCTSGTGCLVSDRSLLDYFEVTLDLQGQPIAVWSASTLGTGVGIAVQGTDVHFGGLASGTPLR